MKKYLGFAVGLLGLLITSTSFARAQCVGPNHIGAIIYCPTAVSPQGTDYLLLYQNSQNPHTRKVQVNALPGSSGSVSSVSVATANGFAGTVANPTTTPAITIQVSITGLLKGNGTGVSAAVAGTDYLLPGGSGAALTGIIWSQIGSTPTTLAGYGITDGLSRTLPSADLFVGNGSNVATGVAMSGDASLANTGAVTVSKTGGVAFAASATMDTTNANNISAGTLASARMFTATTGAQGAVRPDGTSITISGGIISAVTGGTGCTVPGATTNVLYNNAGNCSANAGFTYDGTSVIGLGVAGSSVGQINLFNATSGHIGLHAATGALSTGDITFPTATDTVVYNALAATLSNKTLVAPALGTIASGDLTNGTNYHVAALTNGGTGVVTALTNPLNAAGGLVSFSGNIGTPNGNGSLLTGLTWSQIGSTPTTLAGYGITDALGSGLTNTKIWVGNGSNNAAQVNVSGDATLANTGALTVSKFGGTSFGTAAGANTGTSGAALGLLNANKTDSGNNTFSGNNGFSGVTTFTGSLKVPMRVFTAAGSVTVSATTDYFICVNKGTGAATTVNLPATPGTGLTFLVKDCKGDAAINNITLAPSSGLIDGSSTYVISNNYGSVAVTYTGSAWALN